jgi:DNA-directed RNA polymerase I subunit RPA1
VDFGFLSSAEIKSLSVKKIQNPATFDTLLHPVSEGLYDPALGAWGSVP